MAIFLGLGCKSLESPGYLSKICASDIYKISCICRIIIQARDMRIGYLDGIMTENLSFSRACLWVPRYVWKWAYKVFLSIPSHQSAFLFPNPLEWSYYIHRYLLSKFLVSLVVRHREVVTAQCRSTCHSGRRMLYDSLASFKAKWYYLGITYYRRGQENYRTGLNNTCS